MGNRNLTMLMQEKPFMEAVKAQTEAYQNFVKTSEFADASIAPRTLEMLAEFVTLTQQAKMDRTPKRGEDGHNERTLLISAELIVKCKEAMKPFEGFSGDFATKVLSQVFNHSSNGDEISADPVLLLHTLRNAVEEENLPEEIKQQCHDFIDKYFLPHYLNFARSEVASCLISDHDSCSQTVYETYISNVDKWSKGENTKEELQFMETVEEIGNVISIADFRMACVHHALRYMANNNGAMSHYDKTPMARLFENYTLKKVFYGLSIEQEASNDEFKTKMRDGGYTDRQTERLTQWIARAPKP